MFGRKDRYHAVRSLGSAVFVAATLATRFAAAAPESTVRFAWVRGVDADTCPNQATLIKIVQARLGRDPFSPESSRFIEGVVERRSSGWFAHIRLSKDGTILGTRELTSEAADCSAITAASVLAIAIGIDPDAPLLIEPPPPATPAPTNERSEPPKAPPEKLVEAPKPKKETGPVELPPDKPSPPRAVAPSAARFPRISVSPRGMLGTAMLPRTTPGFMLMTGLEGQRWEGSLGMIWLPDVKTAKGEAAFGITAIALGSCLAAVRTSRLSLHGCLHMYGGSIHETVVSLQSLAPLDVNPRAWFAASPSVCARITLVDHFAIDAGVGFVIPILPYDFVVIGQPDPLFSMNSLGLMTFLGPTVSIP